MESLKPQNIKKIHDVNINLQQNSSTSIKFVEQKPQRINITNDYHGFGCCTSSCRAQISDKNGNYSYVPEYAIIQYNLNTFPSTYRSLERINEWLNFINETFEFCNTHVVAHNEQFQNQEYFESLGLTFSKPEKNMVYIMYDKKFYEMPNRTSGDATHIIYNFENLFTLSLIRYFVSYQYYFMIYETLRLRKLKSLSKCSNWEILNIAKFANMNYTGLQNVHNEDFFMLWGYRSPLQVLPYTQPHNSIDKVYTLLKNVNGRQNSSCGDQSKIININTIYLMLLYQKARYTKLFKLITNPKYIVDHYKNGNEAKEFQRRLYPALNENIKNPFMNYQLNIKEYEKTL